MFVDVNVDVAKTLADLSNSAAKCTYVFSVIKRDKQLGFARLRNKRVVFQQELPIFLTSANSHFDMRER